MHSDVSCHLDLSGFITRPEILAHGFDDRMIAACLRQGSLRRIGPGLYTDARYDEMSPADKHVLRCHAVATRFPDAVAFTHQSAALIHGLPLWGASLDRVHVTRLDSGRGRRQAGVTHHVGGMMLDECAIVDGLPVSNLPRTIWDLACSESTETALVTIDAALQQRRVTHRDLFAIADRYATWRGSRHAKVALALSDEKAESPGESRTRWAFHVGRLPPPVSQFKVFDDNGELVGIADFAWPEFRHLGEFDGLMKYGSTSDLAREKAREDRLRALGWGMTRVIWSQLAPALQPVLISDLRQAMEQSRRQFRHHAAA